MTRDLTASNQVTITVFNPLSGNIDVIAAGGAEVLSGAITELDHRLEQIEAMGAIDYRDAGMVRMIVTVEVVESPLGYQTLESMEKLVRFGREAGISTLTVENGLDNTVLAEVSV